MSLTIMVAFYFFASDLWPFDCFFVDVVVVVFVFFAYFV